MDDRVRALALELWNYHQLHHRLVASDVILVLCSYDTSVAERGAELWFEGWAPTLIFSGGLGAITRKMWNEPEADQFARIAIAKGVPADRILIENASTNTGENVRNTRRMLEAAHVDPKRFILVQKPYMERRAYATFQNFWPGKSVVATSPRATFDEYLARFSNDALSPEDVIAIMVGDLQRIRLYPEKGFQIPQEIPAGVWAAYEELVAAGFDRHLVTA